MTLPGDRPVSGAERFSEFATFYTSAFPIVMSRVFLLVGQRHLAEDLAQDAMVVMMQQWRDRSGHPLTANVAWAVGIAANLAYRHRRRLLTGARIMARWATHFSPVVTHVDTEVLGRDETYRQIARLSRQQRAVAVLRVLGDQSVEEIAATLGISASTVRTHLQRIRAQLDSRAGQVDEVEPCRAAAEYPRWEGCQP